MTWRKCAYVISMAIALSGCNTFVPDPQEFYEDHSLAPVRVQTMIQHIVCELKTAVQTVLVEDYEQGPFRKSLGLSEKPRLYWLRKWSAQLTLTLTVDEKSGFNPSFGFTDVLPNAVSRFSRNRSVTSGQSSGLAVSAAYSTDATTKETHSISLDLESFADPKELAAFVAARNNAKSDGIRDPRLYCQQSGQIFLRGDLKLTDWLRAATASAVVEGSIYGNYQKALEAAEKKQKKDVLSNQITFVLMYGGGITPSLRLVDFAVNQSSNPFFNPQRTKTQDLIVTLGPTEDGQLSTAAQNTILASQIGISVANAVRSSQ